MKKLLDWISNSQKILLSTHKQCDGDGLGAQMALELALKKIGKEVRIINVDRTPHKYRFLNPHSVITYFEEERSLEIQGDLCLIFDTNDSRLLPGLFGEIEKNISNIAFIDHHPLLLHGPQPSEISWIDESCASTGEMTYEIIKSLGIPLDKDIARCLYTSITFDTQLYKFIRNSPRSHRIAAELLEFDIHPEEVHRHLFGNMTVQKVSFLAHVLSHIEYACQGRLVLSRVSHQEMISFGVDYDEVRDIIDTLMNIESIEGAIFIREDGPNLFKVSFRSKGKVPVLPLAESIGGGGHAHASGATYKGSFESLKDPLILKFCSILEQYF